MMSNPKPIHAGRINIYSNSKEDSIRMVIPSLYDLLAEAAQYYLSQKQALELATNLIHHLAAKQPQDGSVVFFPVEIPEGASIRQALEAAHDLLTYTARKSERLQ